MCNITSSKYQKIAQLHLLDYTLPIGPQSYLARIQLSIEDFTLCPPRPPPLLYFHPYMLSSCIKLKQLIFFPSVSICFRFE